LNCIRKAINYLFFVHSSYFNHKKNHWLALHYLFSLFFYIYWIFLHYIFANNNKVNWGKRIEIIEPIIVLKNYVTIFILELIFNDFNFIYGNFMSHMQNTIFIKLLFQINVFLKVLICQKIHLFKAEKQIGWSCWYFLHWLHSLVKLNKIIKLLLKQ